MASSMWQCDECKPRLLFFSLPGFCLFSFAGSSILNRLKPRAEKIIAKEQVAFRADWSTTEQIFNLRIRCEKYLQHQQDLCHVFIDFKKAFDRVWHAALWVTMKKCNISANLIQVVKNLCETAPIAVLFNSSIGHLF